MTFSFESKLRNYILGPAVNNYLSKMKSVMKIVFISDFIMENKRGGGVPRRKLWKNLILTLS